MSQGLKGLKIKLYLIPRFSNIVKSINFPKERSSTTGCDYESPFVETSEIFKVVPQQPFQTKGLLTICKTYITDPLH